MILSLTNSLKNAVPDVIDVMDQYYLTKDDWEALIELGVGENREETVLKQIATATKTSFTKKCASAS
jgi:replication factor C subunit 1